MNDKVREALREALHEASVYGIGATSNVNQIVILNAAIELFKIQWQPISTAPKDGSRFIIGNWDGNIWRSGVARWNVELNNFYCGSVQYEDNIKIDLMMPSASTHWQPLPEPPKKE